MFDDTIPTDIKLQLHLEKVMIALNYDLKALQGAISDSTKMIMIVNLLGNPNNFNKIKW